MFCSNCGKELANGAVVCTGCGCLVENIAERTIASVETKNKNMVDKKIVLKSFAVVALVSFCIALMFVLFALAYPYFIFNSYTAMMYKPRFYSVFVIPAFVFGLLSFCSGLIAFIMCFKKGTEGGLQLVCIFAFTLSMAIVAVAISLMISRL